MTVFRGVLTTWPGRLVAVALVVAVGGGALLASRANSQPPKQELRTQAVTKGSVTQSVAVSGSVAVDELGTASPRLLTTYGKDASEYLSNTELASVDTEPA